MPPFRATIELVTFTPVFTLLLLKLYELVRSTVWAVRHGSAYTDDLVAALRRWNKTGFDHSELEIIMSRHDRTWSPTEWPATGLFLRLRAPPKDSFVNIIFRFPTLIVAMTGVIIFSAGRLVLTLGVLLLWLGLWVITVHSMVYRYTQGYWDNYFARTVSVRMLPYPEPQPTELNPPRLKTIREFAKVFVWLLALVIIGYTGIYTGLSELLGNKNAFEGIQEGWARPFDLFYFSVVTLATVGFGDVQPNQNALIVRLAVASQILTGFCLIVFLLTSFTLTVEPHETGNDN